MAGVKYILDQLIQAPEVSKREHLGQQICLNSTPTLELEYVKYIQNIIKF